MIWKSLREEWPYVDDEIWLRWTEDGVSYQEAVVHEKKIPEINCLGVAEWRPMDAPEWMTDRQKEKFDKIPGSWQKRVTLACEESDGPTKTS